ncbi:MAG: hypothetical protein M1814_005527 [Vezdaea aestivalis]|nr:MAG: hypothetical protein M1814_005527 [Vezdaea aestivalis]
MRTFKAFASRSRPNQSPSPSPASEPFLAEHSGDELTIDIEKRMSRFGRLSEDSDYTSDFSSRHTSDSYSPMLKRHPRSSYRRLRLPNLPPRATRYLCLGLVSTVFLLIFGLFQLSARETRRLESGPPIITQPQPSWEDFPFMFRYYGGLRSLVSKTDNSPEYPGLNGEVEGGLGGATENTSSVPLEIQENKSDVNQSTKVFNPYPDYTSTPFISKFGASEECFLDVDDKVSVPHLRFYEGVPLGFADPVIGSNSLLGIKDNMCMERFGRLGPYGYGYSTRHGGTGTGTLGDRTGADQVWKSEPEVDYRNIDWSVVQQRCSDRNAYRFKRKVEMAGKSGFQKMGATKEARQVGTSASPASNTTSSKASTFPLEGKARRTAVLIRTWTDYHYTTEDILYLRSLVSELAIHSRGEYTIFFLIHVKDNRAQIWADEEVYQKVLEESLPAEFKGMGVLWSESQMSVLYPGLEDTFTRGLPVHGVYRSTYMPVQYFAKKHPEFDFFWHWEMDARYTGNYYHLFDRLSSWAKEQPRKGLWERNSRFYIPSVHGSWDEFKQMTRFQTELGTDSANNIWSGLGNGREEGQKGDKPVWGPEAPLDDELDTKYDSIPPTSYARDNYKWGVGEEADFITLNPLFDPDGTTWLLRDDTTGYNKTRAQPPRRVAIVTASRLSRKLLLTMHNETSQLRHTMFSEMWPGSAALHHGFKAVYAPHPMYIDRRWPTKYLANIFNGGRNGAAGGARTAVFGEREHNFLGTTWYYNAGFAPNLWLRWLGLKNHNDGGEQWELEGEGRMCLPPMLLHPMKGTELIVEEEEEENQE